jgi:hypothetical protein
MSAPSMFWGADAADEYLRPVTAALAELEDMELRALVDAANELVLVAAGLLLWVEHIADWEINRRAGLELPLQPPNAAIPPEEDEHSIAAAAIIRAHVADSRDETDPMVALFDAILGALTGRGSLQ